MLNKKSLSFLITFSLLCSIGTSTADNWLLDESAKNEIFIITPVRKQGSGLSNYHVLDFQVKNIEIFDYKSNKKIEGYGFNIKQDGHSFDFDQNLIPRFYLYYTGASFNRNGGNMSWGCKEGYFKAVVEGQNERVTPDYPGLSNFYPKGTLYKVSYISETNVLGKKRIKKKMGNIEVWGFANSEKNALKMVEYFKSRIVSSTYHHFSATPLNYSNSHHLLNDLVKVNFYNKPKNKKSRRNSYNDEERVADFYISLNVNGHEEKWVKESREILRRSRDLRYDAEYFWTEPGWLSTKLDGRKIKMYVTTMGKDSDIWVQYLGPTPTDVSKLSETIYISQCD